MLHSYFIATCVILQGPHNTATVVGRETMLTCEPSYQATISWYYTSFGANSLTIINRGEAVEDGFPGVEVKGGIPGQQLVIRYTQPHHAGSYRCTVFWKTSLDRIVTEKASAILTVLGQFSEHNRAFKCILHFVLKS